MTTSMQIYKGNRQGNIIPYTYPKGRYAVPYIDNYSQILAHINQVLSNIDHILINKLRTDLFSKGHVEISKDVPREETHKCYSGASKHTKLVFKL